MIKHYILYLKYRMGEKHRIDVKGIKFTKSDTPSSLVTGTGISRGICEDTECYMNGIWLYILSITTFYI